MRGWRRVRAGRGRRSSGPVKTLVVNSLPFEEQPSSLMAVQPSGGGGRGGGGGGRGGMYMYM